MALRFRGGERLQRGRGIGGLLRVAKGLFKPLFKSAQTALTSNAAKAAGKAITNQLVESGANIATAALMGNNVNDSLKSELEAGQQNADMGVKKLKRTMELKGNEKLFKKKMDLILERSSENLMILQQIMEMVEDLKKDHSRKKKKAKIFHLHDGRVLKWE